jgi:hypothetical protein
MTSLPRSAEIIPQVVRYLFAVGWLSIMVAVSSCAGVTPQENYAHAIRMSIGSKIDDFYNLVTKRPLSERVLPNGSVEYKYRYAGDCVETYEVDPQTRIIRNASYEGSAKWCNLAP